MRGTQGCRQFWEVICVLTAKGTRYLFAGAISLKRYLVPFEFPTFRVPNSSFDGLIFPKVISVLVCDSRFRNHYSRGLEVNA